MTFIRKSASRITALRWLCAFTVVAIQSGILSCSNSNADDDSNAITIGLLLPFTGVSSGTSANFERAAIFASDRINAAGGIQGKRLRLISADTHSSVKRSAESAARLINDGAVAIIGVESADIAAQLEATLLERNVVFVSPLVGAADDRFVNCSERWFRLAPSARSLGEALAKQLSANQVQAVAVLSETDSYSSAFGDAVKSRFLSLNGQVTLRQALDSSAQSYYQTVNQVLAAGVSNIVLTTTPRTAALVINEFDAATRDVPNWYLSPLLKTDLLMENVSPAALDGARGVAPRIFAKDDEFRRAFQNRWEEELPLEGAFFYYDAVALVAFALEITAPNDLGEISSDALKQSIINAANTTGESMGWDEFDKGLKHVREGKKVYYTGLTGPLVFNRCGVRQIGTYSTWTVKAGNIVDE
jgi:branched-chain amino acid transport system substrate-binding protein